MTSYLVLNTSRRHGGEVGAKAELRGGALAPTSPPKSPRPVSDKIIQLPPAGENHKNNVAVRSLRLTVAGAMIDDGMLLNFATTEVASTYKPRFKGGSWRERMVAKRVARHRQQRRVPTKPGDGKENVDERDAAVLPTQDESDFSKLPAAKRRRENGDYTHASRQAAAPRLTGAHQDHSRSRNVPQPREVISSLFSYNPKPATEAEQPSDPTNDVPAQPSNAPLVDGADTFASLGLSNVLANHLITK